MNPNKLFPLVVTTDLAKTKAFYTQKAGFTVTTEVDGYIALRYGDDPEGPELSFMTPCPETSRAEAFEGRGLILSIPTANADATHAALRVRGAEPLTSPADKPWGWRSFHVVDPNGVILDFFHVIAQSAAADATG